MRGEKRWMKEKRDKVFVGSRSHVTYLCGGLSVYATYRCACITTFLFIHMSPRTLFEPNFNYTFFLREI